VRGVRRIGAWLLLVALLLASGYFLLKRSSKTEEAESLPSAPVTRGDFRLTVSGSGSLAAVASLDLKSPVAGVLVHLVEVGERVEKGAVLAELDPKPYQRAVENARLALEKARNQLQSAQVSLENTLASLTQQLASAESAYQNAKNALASAEEKLRATELLYQAGGATRQALEEARRAYVQAQVSIKSAEVALETAKKNLALRRDQGEKEIAVQELAVRQAKIALENAEEDLQSTKIVAPFAGVVTAVNGQVGEKVSAGTPLVPWPTTGSWSFSPRSTRPRSARSRLACPRCWSSTPSPVKTFGVRWCGSAPRQKSCKTFPSSTLPYVFPTQISVCVLG
jgi:Multidrug resistance efflux pump